MALRTLQKKAGAAGPKDAGVVVREAHGSEILSTLQEIARTLKKLEAHMNYVTELE